MHLKSFEWHRYSPRVRKGRLCYYNCTTKSDLPLRDLLGGLTEPNYETMTYNYYYEGICALIGFLEIDWFNDHVPYEDGYVVYKGSTNSRRFRNAVKFDGEFVEDIPFLTAAGAPWNWEKDTELGVINARTRGARQHIDPSADLERAARFWRRIWASQEW